MFELNKIFFYLNLINRLFYNDKIKIISHRFKQAFKIYYTKKLWIITFMSHAKLLRYFLYEND